MHFSILAALWLTTMSFLLTSGVAIHQRYQQSISQKAKIFERQWKQLEKQYENQL